MKRKPLPLRISIPLVMALSLGLALSAALISGCAQTKSSDQGASPSTPGTFTPGGTEPQSARDARGIAYYAAKDEKVVPVRVDSLAKDPESVVKALFAGVPDEARDAGYSSAIPEGTRLLALSIETSTAVVDVSSEFGSGGGSTAMQKRVAQVVFTLTRDPAVTKVIFKMEGKPITALGGEGLSLTEPQARADWEDFSPAILIESPVLNDTVSDEFIVKGTANVFEGKFRLEVLDSEGSIRTTHKVTTASGTGTRGSFVTSETASYVPEGTGYLVSFYLSPKDSKRVISMKVPLTVK